jgi:hypothetical protein
MIQRFGWFSEPSLGEGFDFSKSAEPLLGFAELLGSVAELILLQFSQLWLIWLLLLGSVGLA